MKDTAINVNFFFKDTCLKARNFEEI